MATQIPPLPQQNVPEFLSNTMTPTWRQFWINLLSFLRTPTYTLGNYANDAAAAAGGVAIGQMYRTGNAVQIRLT